MAKPNYSFEKRQRELARKKKQEEKRLRHARSKSADDGSIPAEVPEPLVPAPAKPVSG